LNKRSIPLHERYVANPLQGMAEPCQYLYISNMTQRLDTIQSYSLFGESTHLPDVLHCETIADRSVLHDWELAPHRHARLHQVLLIQSGGGVAQLDGVTYALTPGSFVNVPPKHVHAFRFQKDTQGWVTTFADELMDELFVGVGDVRQDLSRACVVKADPSISLTVDQIWKEFSGHAKARALVLRGLSAVLLGWVARAIAPDDLADTPLHESHLVQRFKALIEDHFLDHWQVNDYAHALAISPTHLSRLTRAATGGSAMRMIEARMMREARRNLAYTNLSISTIAYTLGYADPAYFSRVFTRDAGVSPKAFRAHIAAL
jgi:AraC family transcriptional activator of pobA